MAESRSDRSAPDEAGLNAARSVAGWYLGYRAWADQLIDAYLNPDEALRRLAVARGDDDSAASDEERQS